MGKNETQGTKKKTKTNEIKKRTKKEIKKDNVEIKIEDDNIPKIRELSSTIRLLSIIGLFFSTLMIVLVTINCTLTSLSIDAFSKEKLVENNTVINYLSKINLYGFTDAKDAIINIENKGAFIVFDVIIPTILVMCLLFTLGFCFYGLYELSKKIKTKKSLFTEDNLNFLKKLRTSFCYIGLLFILVFDVSYYVIVLFAVIILELLVFVFDYVVKKDDENKK